MVRVRDLFLILVAVVCLSPGEAASGQEQQAPWQTDWQKFGVEISPYSREGVVERRGDVLKFNRLFSKKVEWAGKLRGFHSNEVAKFLTLEMQPIRIPLLDGSTVEVSELSISCAVKESGCDGWSAELVGEEVVFRTKLINRTRGVLPVVRVLDGGEEGRTIIVETFGAELVRVVPK